MNWWRRWRAPVWVFLISRLGMGLVAYFGLALLGLGAVRLEHPVWQGFPDNLLLDGWARWDSAQYQTIARQGYLDVPGGDGLRDTRFFPVYPVLMGFVARFTGDYYLAGLLVSNLAFLVALMAIYGLARDRFGEVVAERSLILLCVYPGAVYFNAVYAESLFLAATASAFYLGERRLWLPASLCASVAAATRVPGVLVPVGLALLYMEQIDFQVRRVRWDVLALTLSAFLPAVHCYTLWSRFGDPFRFLGVKVASQGAKHVVESLWLPDVSHLLRGVYDVPALLQAVAFAVAFPLCCLAFFRVRKSWALWGIAHLLVSLLAWHSMVRYVSVLFPIPIVLAQMLPEKVFWAVCLCSTLLLGLATVLFTHWQPTMV